jgi:2-oxoisovalerate/pyruvate ferredoxin oxidoreductase gamma subunit
MVEIIFYGRGGQGAVTAADVLATAAFLEGKYAQSFPSFSGERRGAPVMAFARIADQHFTDRSKIVKADYVIVLDRNLLKTVRPLSSVKESGCAILNLDRSSEEVEKEFNTPGIKIMCIDASAISEAVYGERPLPIVNIAMLGAFAAVSEFVKMESIMLGVDKYFSGTRAEEAKKTAWMAYARIGGMKKAW